MKFSEDRRLNRENYILNLPDDTSKINLLFFQTYFLISSTSWIHFALKLDFQLKSCNFQKLYIAYYHLQNGQYYKFLIIQATIDFLKCLRNIIVGLYKICSNLYMRGGYSWNQDFLQSRLYKLVE